MAMQSIWWNTSVGDGAAPYTQAQVNEWLRKSFLQAPTSEGIVPSVGGEFAPSGTASPVTVASGFAYVYGFPGWDDGNTSVAVPTPLIGTTGHRIVLKADWAAQTVRLVLKSSNDGVAAIPAVTQTAGSVWEISIATLTITTAGVIALTDTRGFAHFNTRVNTVMLDNSAVTTAKIADANVTEGKLATGAVTVNKLGSNAVTTVKIADANVTTAKIADANVTEGKLATSAVTVNKLGSNAVTTVKIADANVTTAKIADANVTEGKLATSAVTNAKLGSNAVTTVKIAALNITEALIAAGAVVTAKLADLSVTAAKLANNAVETAKILNGAVTLEKWAHPLRRQGGNASNWATNGTTNYTPATMRIQSGVIRSSAAGVTTVTFPVGFIGTPVLVARASNTNIIEASLSATVWTFDTFTLGTINRNAVDVHWLAIGPA